ELHLRALVDAARLAALEADAAGSAAAAERLALAVDEAAAEVVERIGDRVGILELRRIDAGHAAERRGSAVADRGAAVAERTRRLNLQVRRRPIPERVALDGLIRRTDPRLDDEREPETEGALVDRHAVRIGAA